MQNPQSIYYRYLMLAYIVLHTVLLSPTAFSEVNIELETNFITDDLFSIPTSSFIPNLHVTANDNNDLDRKGAGFGILSLTGLMLMAFRRRIKV